MFEEAVQMYADQGCDVEKALAVVRKTPVSIHCWQGDDVGGFEHPGATLDGGGIQCTGNYPGKARNIAELRTDLEEVLRIVPGTHKVSLHASYGDFGGKFVDRDEIEPKHFDSWIDWAERNGVGLDFNGTFFSHPMAASGMTLSSKDPKVRAFWIEHEKRSRRIADYMGSKLGIPCILNTWIPDGMKDSPMDKYGYRKILKQSLDECFAIKYPASHMRDALETKLFGIGAEAFTVGSHEFYMEYAARNGQMPCMDLGHFHIGEDVSDKISSILLFHDEILLHVSRPMHWDSDHVVLFNDTVRDVAQALVFSGKLEKANIGMDYFDGSINRIGAWAIGVRAMEKALLEALLSPQQRLVKLEENGKGFEKLALSEQQKVLPFGAVWDEYCRRCNVPLENELVPEIEGYEKKVLNGRN
ncbi:MAG: L-rhamnose isomerase [Sphaerochaetaceae bacterium]|jgi:L-rhamnose isomerase|nr:L-rhamnose isomerase [Sphaerochaetaceae bacterium]MDD3163250.1 L-rhamnose isomerase [Sphaerochaetaceae bacterium]MDD4007389.1 L-rhamnose isomerase [Sphaerochaetaceae bacterium]MDD4396178.1 L-rhamnose isomerase [Sphaerochaetaceae bacterium]